MIETFAVPILAFLAGFAIGQHHTQTEDSADSVAGLLEQRRQDLREDYQEGRISRERFASEIELVEDPQTEAVMHSATDVDGVGPATAFEIAREFRGVDDLQNATVDELENVNQVGENRARAIRSRLTESN